MRGKEAFEKKSSGLCDPLDPLFEFRCERLHRTQVFEPGEDHLARGEDQGGALLPAVDHARELFGFVLHLSSRSISTLYSRRQVTMRRKMRHNIRLIAI